MVDALKSKGENMAASINTDYIKQMTDNFLFLGQKYSTWQVFEDFLALSAISISNSVDRFHFDEREKEYLKIIKKYDKTEVNTFPKIFSTLIMALEQNAERPKDILGVLFHKLELHNKYHGQFFTPNHICDFMGQITFSQQNEILKQKDYVTVAEPCCGSGALILGFACAMANNKHDFQRQMKVLATDIDIKCVYMTYIQLSLYGIPAIVTHGNSLTNEKWSQWYTPIYVMHGWQFKNNHMTETEKTQPIKKAAGAELIKTIPTYNSKINEQLSFF